MLLVVGVGWSFRGKDAGRPDMWAYRADRGRSTGTVQHAPTAQTVFRQTLLGGGGHPPGNALDVGERLVERDHVRVLRLDVEEVRLVRGLRSVADALARDERRKPVLEQVDRGRPEPRSREGVYARDGSRIIPAARFRDGAIS